MPYFFDTNIIIGYLFKYCDRLGIQAVKRVDDSEPNHTGQTTYKECFGINTDTERKTGKARKIYQTINDELREIIYQITEQGLIQYRVNFNQKHYPRTGRLIEKYLNSGILTDANKELVLRQIMACLKTSYMQQQRKILDPKICTWHPARTEPYTSLQKILAEKIENTNDIQVLLDAYCVGQKISNLTIITADKNDILNNKNHILKTLPDIREIVPP